MFSKLGALSLGKIVGKVRGIGYKLGFREFKIEDVDLAKIPQIGLPGEYKEWYPGKEKEIEKAEQIKAGYEANSVAYVKKNQLIF